MTGDRERPYAPLGKSKKEVRVLFETPSIGSMQDMQVDSSRVVDSTRMGLGSSCLVPGSTRLSHLRPTLQWRRHPLLAKLSQTVCQGTRIPNHFTTQNVTA